MSRLRGHASSWRTRDVPRLIEQLSNDDASVRGSAAMAMGRIGADAKDAVPALISALQDEDDEVRSSAAAALGDIGAADRDAVPALINALQDDHFVVRRSAAAALGDIGADARDAVPALIDVLQDDNWEDARLSAAGALGRVGADAEDAVPALINFLQDDDFSRRYAAAEALGRIGAPAVPALFNALQDDGPDVRRSAASALGRIGADAKDAVPALIAALQHDHTDVRLSAAGVLGRIGADARDAVPALINALRDDNGAVQISAAEALASIGIGLQDGRRVDAIRDLVDAQEALEKTAAERGWAEKFVEKAAEDVRRAVVALKEIEKNLWSTRAVQFFSWAKGNPWTATALFLPIAYLVWFLILRFGVLPRVPGSLLRWNEKLSTLQFTLPNWLGGATIPFRNVVLIGLYHYHPRVLEAWVESHIETAQEKFRKHPTVEQRKTFVPLPVILNGNSVAGLEAKDLQAALHGDAWCMLLWGEGGLGKTALVC